MSSKNCDQISFYEGHGAASTGLKKTLPPTVLNLLGVLTAAELSLMCQIVTTELVQDYLTFS
jgi:hypothetical protein